MLKPFTKASSTTIGDLTIETDQDSLVLSGSIELRRDEESRRKINLLISMLQAATGILDKEDLPDVAPADEGAATVDNPFGN
jgi:hypothetical protein